MHCDILVFFVYVFVWPPNSSCMTLGGKNIIYFELKLLYIEIDYYAVYGSIL